MHQISPCPWFDGKAEEAMNFYLAVFHNARVTDVMRYGDAGPGPGPKGSVLTCTFELDGQEFIALNGPPIYQFTPAISLVVKLRDPGRGRRLLGPAAGGRQSPDARPPARLNEPLVERSDDHDPTHRQTDP